MVSDTCLSDSAKGCTISSAISHDKPIGYAPLEGVLREPPCDTLYFLISTEPNEILGFLLSDFGVLQRLRLGEEQEEPGLFSTLFPHISSSERLVGLQEFLGNVGLQFGGKELASGDAGFVLTSWDETRQGLSIGSSGGATLKVSKGVEASNKANFSTKTDLRPAVDRPLAFRRALNSVHLSCS